MNQDDFNLVTEARIDKLRTGLAVKGAEYAPVDKLSNFKKAALFRGITPEDALMGMVIKHITALDDFIGDLTKGSTITGEEYKKWDEKIGDTMAYGVLLDGLIVERMNND